ncbi:hypothetical protein PHLGIDRAFT_493501 [Phlebiopsis gigantea 11061_1 CR5-6]|uniref:Uncharacterized protein n=1 Tax=Phlebiopsis gigantea (strain 11061_1 CR5-6) TaxID=745531 RepID=A0A0C3PTC9_PHLG1|nr:hypothetical protein PHLGIDRAFT_493501 [Phlebiopsis gigantea 11061_1 CR5-6]
MALATESKWNQLTAGAPSRHTSCQAWSAALGLSGGVPVLQNSIGIGLITHRARTGIYNVVKTQSHEHCIGPNLRKLLKVRISSASGTLSMRAERVHISARQRQHEAANVANLRPPVATMFATAADVPPELFDYFLDHLTRSSAPVHDPEKNRKRRQVLSRCALVCRFWASRCEPMLFHTLTLRSLDDIHTLLSLPAARRLHIRDLFMEQTEPCVPWTHLVYASAKAGEFIPNVHLFHKLDGACTPTSVQTLRSLHQSLPRRTPNLFEDNFPIQIHNYRLEEFYDLTQFVRKLWGALHWQLRFSNVSWIKQPDRVPPALGAKISARCDNVDITECVERWPFIWLCVSTRPPEPRSRERTPYVVDEAFALAAMCRKQLLNVSGHAGSDGKARKPAQFHLNIACREENTCTPSAKFCFTEGHLRTIRLEFNTDPNAGCTPYDFDWKEFDNFAAQCRMLTAVTMIIDGEKEYTAQFFSHMSTHMKHTYESGRLQVQYWPEDSKRRLTWVPEPDAEGDVP